MADPEADARAISSDIDWRVEPMERHEGMVMEVGEIWYNFPRRVGRQQACEMPAVSYIVAVSAESG